MNNARRDTEWLLANRPQRQAAKPDIVHNPAHYTEGRRFEPIDVIEDWELPFHLGNALKYISRAGRKDASLTRQDISKAIWYLERFNDQFVESDDQASDADELLAQIHEAEAEYFRNAADHDHVPFDATRLVSLAEQEDQDEIEFHAMGNIPESVLFGTDEDLDLSVYRKDLNKFEDQEIITTHFVDGSILGTQKNGDVRVLGSYSYDDILRADPLDLAPSEFEPEQDDPWRHLPDH